MASFTPEQIEQFLEEFFDTVGRRQYIGARYVPIFGRKDEESIAWDNSAPYEPLTIVLYNGDSYTSRTYVPAGIDISNETYWALTGNYNAQIEAYRNEVQKFSVRIADLETDTQNINEILPSSEFTSTNTVKKYVDDSIATAQSVNEILPSSEFTSTNTVKKYVDDSIATAQSEMETELGNVVANFPNTYYGKKLVVIGDSFSDDSRVTLTWYDAVCEALDMTLARFAVGGAGFVHTGSSGTSPTFATQIQNAYNTGIRDTDIGAIIVLGGINDFLSGKTYTETRSGVDNLYNAIHDNFPLSLCKTFVCFGNTGYTNQAIYNNFMPWYGQVKSYIDGHPRWVSVDYVQYWTNFFGKNVFTFDNGNDTVHPDNNGNYLIAHYIIQVLCGCYTGVRRVIRNAYTGTYTRNSTDSVTVTGVPIFENGFIHWSGTVENLIKAQSTWNNAIPLIEHPMMGTKLDIIPCWTSAPNSPAAALGINETGATIFTAGAVTSATMYYLPAN